jgi:hypothetical protein
MANPFLGQDNPYLTSMIDKAQGDVVRNYNMTTQPAYNSAMVKSGSFGNAGVQEMNQNSRRNMQDTLGNISTQMRGQDYLQQQDMYKWDQGFDRSLYNDAFGQNQQQFQNAIGLLGQLQGYGAGDITNANNIQNTPLNYFQQFANSANSMGQGYGNTTVSGGGSSPLVGALGGAQLGAQFAKQWGGGTGSGDWASGTGNYAQYTQPDYGSYL